MTIQARTLRLTALLLIAACDSSPPAPRAPAQGEAARAAVDRLTQAYAACVDRRARTEPVTDDVAGSLVDRFVKECAPARVALADKTAAFYRIGHPATTPHQAANVADASIKDLEDEIRSRAVVAVIERQNPTKAR